jgi:hypothetical protein
VTAGGILTSVCVIALVCFLFPLHEGTAFSLRVGINTSMLITAVLFNLAVQNNLPPLTKVTFYDVLIRLSRFSQLAWLLLFLDTWIGRITKIRSV